MSVEVFEVKSAIEAIVENYLRKKAGFDTVLCVVTGVNMEQLTCTCESVENDGDIYYDVRLNALMGNDLGFILVPKVGSTVAINRIDKTESFVGSYSELEEVILNVEKTTINEGKNGGLVKISALVSELDALKNDNNTLKNIFQSWTPVPNDGGAALKGLAATWAGQALTMTNQKDLENEKVTH